MISPVLKERCREAVSNALAIGVLERPNRCEKCGREARPEAHHRNYLKPLEVEWLCLTCHGQVRARPRVPRFYSRMWPELQHRLRVHAAQKNLKIWEVLDLACEKYLEGKE